MSQVVVRPHVTPNERANTYINNMLASIDGLKVLIVDEEMKNVLSILFTQSELLEHQVVFVGMLGPSNREQMKHLSCIIWCRDNDTNRLNINRELQWGNYSKYGIFFTRMVGDDVIQVLANSDRHHLVERVEEVYLDVTPIAESVSVIPLRPTTFSAGRNELDNPVTAGQWTDEKYRRVVDGMLSSILMMNCRPVIRARAHSEVCQRIARDLTTRMAAVNSNFPDLRDRECVLLIMERLDDPMTPLLAQRSYSGMIHELIGFEDGNKVTIASSGSPTGADASSAGGGEHPDEEGGGGGRGGKREPHTHVLNPKVDAVFRENAYTRFEDFLPALSNWFGEARKNLGISKEKINRDTMSPKELRALQLKLEPITRAVERHEEIYKAIHAEVRTRNLTMLTGMEQSFFALDDVLVFNEEIRSMVSSSDYEVEDALKLAVLYNLRYENSSQKITEELKEILRRRNCPAQRIALIDKVAGAAGHYSRMHSLWKDGLKKVGEDLGKSMLAGIKAIGTLNGVIGGGGSSSGGGGSSGSSGQVGMPHQPLMRTLINRLYNGRLSDLAYPVHHPAGHTATEAASMRPKEIMVFVPGGVAFEEAQLVADINKGKVENRVEAVVTGNLGKTRYEVQKIGNPTQYAPSVPSTAASAPSYAGAITHAESPMIHSKVSLFSTAVVNWSQFLASFDQSQY